MCGRCLITCLTAGCPPMETELDKWATPAPRNDQDEDRPPYSTGLRRNNIIGGSQAGSKFYTRTHTHTYQHNYRKRRPSLTSTPTPMPIDAYPPFSTAGRVANERAGTSRPGTSGAAHPCIICIWTGVQVDLPSKPANGGYAKEEMEGKGRILNIITSTSCLE